MPYKDKKKAHEYKLRWQEKRRAEHMDDMVSLRSQPCTSCGNTYPWYIMQFDHRDRSEKANTVSKLFNRGARWEDVLAEIDKCDLVCPNCHAIKTYDNQDFLYERT